MLNVTPTTGARVYERPAQRTDCICYMAVIMKIDCSKISNKGDLLALIGMLVIVLVIGVALYLAIYVDSFVAGFFNATIIWKWHDWIYKPIDQALDKLWPPDEAT